MSEAAENLNDGDIAGDSENVDAIANNNDSQYTEIEQEALTHGWKPDGVEGKRNVGADEFMDKKSLFDRIHKLEKSQSNDSRVINELKDHNSKIEINAYKKAISDLKSARKEAAKEDDVERVVEISDQIENMQSAEPRNQPNQPNAWDEAFNDFTSGNVWYGRVPGMTQTADSIGTQFANANPNASPQQVYAHILDKVKQQYPDEFGTPNNQRPAAVAGNKNGGTKLGKKSYTVKDLPEDYREMARRIISTGIKESDYVKQVLEMG